MALNITPHIPQVVVNASVPSTEALARSNAIKEVVPAPTQVEANVPQKSREQDTRGPANDNVTYDRLFPKSNEVIPEDPQGQSNDSDSQQQGQSQDSEPKDDSGVPEGASTIINPGDSADASEPDEKQIEQQEREQELKEIQQLSARDAEVRNHELAHAAVGGSYAGSPSYEYETGPDGKKYAVGGEVSIDVSEGATPQETIEKMQTVRAAALAPAEPSSQDRKVAAQASQNIAEARVELVRESEENRKAVAESVSASFEQNTAPEDMSVNGDNIQTLASSPNVSDQVAKTASVVSQRYNNSYINESNTIEAFTAVA